MAERNYQDEDLEQLASEAITDAFVARLEAFIEERIAAYEAQEQQQ